MKNIIILILISVSCSKSKNDYYFDSSVSNTIAMLAIVKPPPAVVRLIKIYIMDEDNQILESNIMDLKMLYDNFYKNKYSEFQRFLFLILNHKIYVPLNYKGYLRPFKAFVIDSKIKKDYEKQGINILLKKYCFLSNGFYILNRGALSLNDINSISYYFFINQYFRVDDDYYTTINFKKLNLLLQVN